MIEARGIMRSPGEHLQVELEVVSLLSLEGPGGVLVAEDDRPTLGDAAMQADPGDDHDPIK